jgi:hypothetical protein
MKRTIWLIIILIPLTSALAKPLPFKVGERAVYDVIVDAKGPISIKGKLGQNVVEVMDITNIRGHEVVHCKAVVSSVRWISYIYTLRDEFHVWSDTETYMPHRIEKFVHEGEWTNHIRIEYYYDKGYGIYNDRRTTDKKFDIPDGGAFDILSMFFYIRGVDKKEPVTLNWTENMRTKKMEIYFSEGKRMRVKPIDRRDRFTLINAHEQTLYDITISMAKEQGYVPVYANVPAFDVYGYEISIQGVLKKYDEGGN